APLCDEARWRLSPRPAVLDACPSALEERFRHPRLGDFLIRTAAAGSARRPVRVLPVIAARGGPRQAPGSVAAVAAWTTWVTDRVRGGHEVADPQAEAIGQAVDLSDDTEHVSDLLAILGVAGADPLVPAVAA